MAVDARLFDRVDCKALALVKAGNITIRGEVENLSLKGLFVKTCSTIPMDESVDVTIYFLGDSARLSFSLEGKVVRVTDDGIGLSFRRIDVDSLIQDSISAMADKKSADVSCSCEGHLALAH
jgi:PilZ domain